ncbi:MAG: 6-carboxytetrahydropterin synthase, partial [Acidobacteriota bacterium]
MEIAKTFTFEAAHWLPNVPPDHKCRHLHGHSYRVTVHIEGDIDPALGWVIDFADIKRIVKPHIDLLDH